MIEAEGFLLSINELKNFLKKLKTTTNKPFYKEKIHECKIRLNKAFEIMKLKMKSNDKKIPAEFKRKISTLINIDVNDKENVDSGITLVSDIEKDWSSLEVMLSNIPIKNKIFSNELEQKLEKKFTKEIKALRNNYGICADCSAFILRKIFEKGIFFCFAKNRNIEKLKDPSKNGGQYVGLERMIDLAPFEKIDGMPILNSRTANKLKEAKFLFDTAVHNYLVDIDFNEIEHYKPNISIALKEIVKSLKL